MYVGIALTPEPWDMFFCGRCNLAGMRRKIVLFAEPRAAAAVIKLYAQVFQNDFADRVVYPRNDNAVFSTDLRVAQNNIADAALFVCRANYQRFAFAPPVSGVDAAIDGEMLHLNIFYKTVFPGENGNAAVGVMDNAVMQ